jgi:Phage major capsid protein E
MSDLMADLFGAGAFSLSSLTDQIMKLKFKASRLTELGLFQESSVSTTSIDVEEKGQTLALVAPSPRGGPGVSIDKNLRVLRQLKVPHFQLDGGVTAEEVQGIRAFGQVGVLDTVMNKVNEHMGDMSRSLELTVEAARVGAIKGVVTYADGSSLNLFTEFGVSQPSVVNFDLDNATAAPGALRKTCQDLIRSIAYALDGVPFTGIRAFCGDQFYDDLISNAEVRQTFLNFGDAALLRDPYVSPTGSIFGQFSLFGITWENYRGYFNGTPFIESNKAYFVPEGVPGFLRTYYAPADYNETVNTAGLARYAMMLPTENRKGYSLSVQTNVLNICTRPNALFSGENHS